MQESSPDEIRVARVSPAENLLCAVHDSFDSDGMVVMAAGVAGVFNERFLKLALRALQRRHPRLRARVVMRRCRYYEVYTVPPQIPVEIIDGEFSDADVAKAALRLHEAGVAMDIAPMVRVIVLRDSQAKRCSLLAAVPHAILDGVSSKRFVGDFFRYYSQVEASDEPERLVEAIESLPFLAPFSAPVRIPWWKSLPLKCSLVRERVRKRRTKCAAVPETDRPDPRYRELRLTGSQTQAFLRACKEQGCGVYGAAGAAAMFAVRDALQAASPSFSYRCPIDMRNVLPGPDGAVGDEQIGCFLSAFESVVTLPPDADFWQTASNLRTEVANFIESGGPGLAYNFLRFLRMKRINFVPRRGTLALNSLGIMDDRPCPGGSIEWTEYRGFPKWRAVGPYFGILTFTVQGRMTVALGTVVARGDIWERFADSVTTAILDIAEGRQPYRSRY